MGVDILGYMSHLITDPESTPAKTVCLPDFDPMVPNQVVYLSCQSISGLMKYLSGNLQFLSNKLMTDVFKM